MDIATDDAGVWMTYGQLADARDIQRDAARRLAQRHRWRRHTGNDGFARVLVPPEWASVTRDISRDVIDDVAPDKENPPVVQQNGVAPDVAGVVAALQGAIDTLRQQLVRADAHSDELRAERDQAHAAAREAQLEVQEARQRVADLRRELETLIQADAARRGQGRWTRLRAAWRGE